MRLCLKIKNKTSIFVLEASRDHDFLIEDNIIVNVAYVEFCRASGTMNNWPVLTEFQEQPWHTVYPSAKCRDTDSCFCKIKYQHLLKICLNRWLENFYQDEDQDQYSIALDQDCGAGMRSKLQELNMCEILSKYEWFEWSVAACTRMCSVCHH